MSVVTTGETTTIGRPVAIRLELWRELPGEERFNHTKIVYTDFV